MNGKDWIEHEYDAIAAEYGDDGITQKEARDLLAQRYENAVRCGDVERDELDLYDEGKQLFDRVVSPMRNRRKNALQNDMQLDIAYPLGTPDGRDKILRLWTREDWRRAQITRYSNAAEVTAAAHAFAELAESIVAGMARKNADTTSGLFE